MQRIPDPQRPTAWADFLQVGRRSDLPVLQLRFFHQVDQLAFETSRLMVSETHAKRMIDLLCKMLKYQPELTGEPEPTPDAS